MKRRLPMVAALAAVCSVALCGCGLSGASGQGANPTAAASGKVGGTITFQTWNLKASYEKYFDSLIADFQKQYPGTTVKWVDQPADGYDQKLSAQASSNTLPDVINVGPSIAYPLAKAGMLLDISKADPSAKQDFLPAAWESMDFPAFNGVYGYPWYLSTGPSLFNTNLMKQAGLDPSKLPTTYDELFDQATAMAKVAGGNYTMVGSSPTIEDLGMYGSQLMNANQTKFTFNDAKGVQLVQRYKDLYNNGGMLKESLSQTYTGQDSQFQSGKIAYMPGSAYNIDQIKQNAPSVYSGLKVAPVITNEKPNMYVQALSVSAKSQNQATAIAFAKFATNKTNQMKFAKQVAVFPSTVNTLSDPYFTKSDGSLASDVQVDSAAQIANAEVYSPAAFTEPMKTELRDQIALAIEGKKPVQKALDDAVAYCNQRLAD